MADSTANNNVTKLSTGLQAGGPGLTNITDETPIEDIANAYVDTGHQLSEIAENAYHDVFNRQTKRVGNNFGESPYNYNAYYQPGINDTQSALRVAGTQHALEVGMDRAKKDAEQRLKDAQNNYSNAQTTLNQLEQARKNAQTVQTGEIGGGTSASELLKFAEAANAENAEELNRDVSARYLSDELVGNNWNIRSIRDQAKADTLAKFGISEEQYKNFSQEEHDAFWARGDVGAYWTNRYAYQYAQQTYGDQVANDYQAAYEHNYNVVKQIFDAIKSGADALQYCPAYIKVARVENTDVNIETPQIMANQVSYEGNTYNFSNSEDEGYDKLPESTKQNSIYNFVTAEDGKEIKQLYEKWKSYSPGLVPDEKAFEEHKKDTEALRNKVREAISKSGEAAKKNASTRKVSFESDYENVENLVEGAFGADFQSINYLMNMRANNPQQYEDLIHDYSLVLTYGQVFEIADGKKTYHTPEGDKVLEEGTYVMYMLPGFQDANGEFLEPNLKRIMQLRSGEFDATMDQAELDEEMNKAMEGYQRVVSAALFLAAGSDCDTNESIVHAAIYASDPTRSDTKKGAVYNGHTVAEILEKFAELADKDGETAYTLFTKIINKASSVSGSLMANYGGKLTSTKTTDEKGRNMVGSEIVGAKDANTLFTEGDIDNLTVEEATALWGIIGTSIDQYNGGKTEGNIKSDFLTADGLNWFNKFGIETVRGLVGIIDLVGNAVWTGASALGTQIGTLVEGRGGNWTEEEYDRVFKDGRWWGWGGITGNWTGASSIYDQFVGEYKETAFGYGEENQWRMTNNLTHLVNPILEDMWFGSGNENQAAMGVGRTGDDGFNYRTVMNTTASLAGLVASVVAGNYIAKGVGAGAKWIGDLSKSAAKAAAAGIKGKFMRSALTAGANTAKKLMNGAEVIAGTLSVSPADDIARVAANYTDDAINSADDVVNAIVGKAGNADDVVSGVSSTASRIADVSDDIAYRANEAVSSGLASADDVASLRVFSQSYDDSVKALGAAATSITANSADDIYKGIVTYGQKAVKALTGATDDVIDDVVRFVGGKVTKDALSLAHISAYSGVAIDDLANVGSETYTILSNIANVQSGGISANIPKDLAKYISGMSKDDVISLMKDLVDNANFRMNAISHGAKVSPWGMDDTIRFMARNGWDSKRLTLMTKDWLKDQLQDLSTDILYGYIKPDVTNEGTDRETIDEYLTNPLNYVFNLGASGLQYFGGRWANNIAQSANSKMLDRARKALTIAEQTGDASLIERKARRVMKLVSRAESLADKALERGKTLEEVKDITQQCNSYADEAMLVMEEKVFRNMTDDQLAEIADDISGLSDILQSEEMGMTRNLFYAYSAGIVKGNANYFQFKRMLNTYDNGLGNVVDTRTNGTIWKSLFEGRHNILREMDIPRGTVTLAEQKKIYKAMVNHVMELPLAKTIPGLRNSLNNYFDELLNMAKAGGYTKMRAGYLPIESMLNTNDKISAGVRGFSSGEFVLHSATANPYLERSIGLRDEDIVDAILRGDKEIQLKDEAGKFIVDDAGKIQTRELYAPGLNFLDSITNAANAKTFHDYIDPIIGANGSQAGAQGLKNAYIVVNQKGAMKTALSKSIEYDKKVMSNIENDVFSSKAEKTANTKAKTAAKEKLVKAADQNPDIEKTIAKNTAVKMAAEQQLEALKTKATELTRYQREFPAVLMKFVNDAGHIDIKAGFEVFNRYKQIVQNDLKRFKNGEISVGDTMNTPMYRYDRFAWQYGRDKFFGQQVNGYTHKVEVDNTYYGLLNYCATRNVEPSKDMVMRRILMTQEVDPTDANGKLWVSIGKDGTEYPWQSPLDFFKSSGITADATSNIALRKYQTRAIPWYYKPKEKGAKWTAEKFDNLMLDSPQNIKTAKDIVASNLVGKTLPGSKGKLNDSAKRMLDNVTNDILTRKKGGTKYDNITISFGEYIDELSTVMPEVSLYLGAFDKNSGYYDIFRKLNSMQNTGVTFESFREYLDNILAEAHRNGQRPPKDVVKAWAVWQAMEDNSTRAISLGDNFEVNNKEGVDIIDSSREAVEQNTRNGRYDPYEVALDREIQNESFVDRYGKDFSEELAYLKSVYNTPDDLKDGLTALNGFIDAYTNGDGYLQAYKNRIKILNKAKKLIDEDVSGLIDRASGIESVQKRIDNYTKTREHRQKAYGYTVTEVDESFDNLKAFGATNAGSGYSITKDPSQFRAASRNLALYGANEKALAPMREEFEEAVNLYKQALADEHATERVLRETTDKKQIKIFQDMLAEKKEKSLKAQGLVDETRKRFSQAMTDRGIDLTGTFEHAADWSGGMMDYDRMMFEGGSMEGKVNQSIEALRDVNSLLIASNEKRANKLIEEIRGKIAELEAFKQELPDYMGISALRRDQLSNQDSLESSLAFLMNQTIYGDGLEQSSRYRILPDGSHEIVDTKPTNGMFTDEQLNSIGGSTRALGTSRSRLELDASGRIVHAHPETAEFAKTSVDFGNYKDVAVERTIDLGEDKMQLMLHKDDEYIDVENLTPQEVSELNLNAFEKKGSLYRLAIIEETGGQVEKPLTKAFTYGDKQPEFDRLSAANEKAKAVYEYKKLESKTPRKPTADELESYNRAKQNPMASVKSAYDEHMSELAKLKKKNKLTDSDIDISLEDAQTNARMANTKLNRFTKTNKQTIQDISPKTGDIDKKLADLRVKETETVERMAEASSFGDLSENEEYHAARRELAQIRNEISELESVKSGKFVVNGSIAPVLTEDERDLIVSRDAIESEGETYGKYTLVKLVTDEQPDVELRAEDAGLENEHFVIGRAYNREAAYTEWLAFSKDEYAIQAKIEREVNRAKEVAKKAEKNSEKAEKTKVADPDDSTKKTTFKNLSEEAFKGKLKEKATPEQYKAWKAAKDHLNYARGIKDNAKAQMFRDHNGALYLADGATKNLAEYSSYANQLKSRGWKPLKKGEEVPPVDPKADKKARKEMQKAITKNRHAGDLLDSRAQDWQVPQDKKGNILFDAASKNTTIANMEEIYNQVKKVTGLDLDRDGILMSNEYADLLTRIADESTNAGKFRNAVSALSNFSQAVQNAQLAGGASFVNALSIAQLRGAIFQDPRMMKQYIQAVGSMRNSRAVAMFAQDNLPLLSKFVLETGDASIVNDFGAAISTRPGVSDGGVLQNITTNLLNLKEDFIKAKIDNDGSIPKAFKDIVAKDVQNTIFEDATFRNAIPVLRAKMLTANYDAALSQLMRKFPNMDGKLMEKAAIQMAYGKTEAFFNPYRTIGEKNLTDVLDNTFTKQVRDFASSFTNSKSQETVLDTLTGFFFALRYKMMLAGRAYAGATGAIPSVRGAVASRAIANGGADITEETLDTVLNSVGTAFMHSGSLTGIGSLGALAVVAAVQAKSLGIPTAWDDVSWIDEYDGSLKIPEVLLKFQTIGQIWLPNSYNEEQGLHIDPTKSMYGLDTMSSIFTLQNNFFRTFDRMFNPETYYAAPQRGILGSASSEDAINKVLNAPVPRAIGDELIGSNLLSPYKAMYEIIMDSTYFGNNIWEKRKLPDGRDNPNYDLGRNFAASAMHLLGLDQVLDGGKGYNSWVKGKGEPGYVEQDQIGTVKGSGILQHEFWSAAVDMMEGKYIEAIYGAGELPVKVQNLSSKARTEFNTRVKNIIAGYNDEYKAVTEDPASTNADKDVAFREYVKKSADAVSKWSSKHDFALGKDQALVPYVTRTIMAMVSGEYDDNMYYVQDAYWKASKEAQIEGATAANWYLDDDDLKAWLDEGKTAEDFKNEKQKRTEAYNKAMDDEYEARKALIEANRDADGNELIKGLEGFLTDRYSYEDLKAEQRAVNKEVFTSIHAKLDMPVGEFDNFKEMKAYYEKMIEGATSKNQKVNLAMRYNTYVFDLLAPYAEKYGANIVNDGYYNGQGLANDLADYVILPADKKYYGKQPVANYIKDVFNVGYRNGDALPSDKEIYEKFITAQNLMMKGAVSSSIAVLNNLLDKIKKGQVYVSDGDYNKIINMRAILSARSK